jgi:hypothetical protein
VQGGTQLSEVEIYLTQIRSASEFLTKQVEEVPEEILYERPGPSLNTVGWNYFHILRVWDADLNWLAKGQDPLEDAWHRGGFTEKADYNPDGKGGRGAGLGFGYTDAEVDELQVIPVSTLHDYHERLLSETDEYLTSSDDAEMQREMETPFGSSDTPAGRMQHTIGHSWNHIGELRFIKGMHGYYDGTYPGPGK